MTLTKTDLQQALKQQEKTIVSQISEFLEKHVIEPIFTLKQDVSGLKQDVSGLKQDVKSLNQRTLSMYTELETIGKTLSGKADNVLVTKVEESILKRFDRFEENLGNKLENHEKRIMKLEQPSVFPQA